MAKALDLRDGTKLELKYASMGGRPAFWECKLEPGLAGAEVLGDNEDSAAVPARFLRHHKERFRVCFLSDHKLFDIELQAIVLWRRHGEIYDEANNEALIHRRRKVLVLEERERNESAAAPHLVETTSSNQASPQSQERLAPTQPGRAEWNLAAAEEQNRRKRDSVRAALTQNDINPRSGAALAIRQITSFPAHLCSARPEGVSPSDFIPPMTNLEEALFASASQVR